MVLRYYGAAAYAEVMDWPQRLIMRGIEIEQQREAARQLEHLRLSALSDGMEQGREYVPDPSEEKPKSSAHYDLARYRRVEDALELRAYPWAAAHRHRERAIAEADAKWAQLDRLFGQTRVEA